MEEMKFKFFSASRLALAELLVYSGCRVVRHLRLYLDADVMLVYSGCGVLRHLAG